MQKDNDEKRTPHIQLPALSAPPDPAADMKGSHLVLHGLRPVLSIE